MRRLRIFAASLLLCVGVLAQQTTKADVYMYATTTLSWPNELVNGDIALSWQGHPSLYSALVLRSCCPWGGYASLFYDTGGRHAVMQSDGNFVVYDASYNALWSTGTDGNSGAFAALQDDGNFVIYDSSGTSALWAVF